MYQKKSNELLIGADKQSWQITSITHGTLQDRELKKNDPSKLKLYQEMFEQADYTCYYCGFRSEHYQEIHHEDGNHQNFSRSNLKVVCPLCHQCHHLNAAELNGGGELIWLPDISQQDLNHFCRHLFIAQMKHEESAGKDNNYIVKRAFSHLYTNVFLGFKRELVEKFGEEAANLSSFGQILINLKQNNKSSYDKRATWLRNIKLLPSPRRFQLQTEYWKDHTFKNMPVHTWMSLATELNIEEAIAESVSDPIF